MKFINELNKGFFSSQELKNLKFKSLGNNVKISKNCTIVGQENISIGNNVRIDDYVTIICSEGFLKIGSYIHIGSHSHITCSGGVTMNNFSALSQGVKVYSISDDYSGVSLTNPTIPEEFLSVKKEAVNIGKHVIIGSGSVILPGVSIDEGSSVGALSLVNKSLEAWGVYIGVPAKRINFRKKILLEQEDKLIKKIGKILPEFD